MRMNLKKYICLVLFNNFVFLGGIRCQKYFISQELVNWYQALINCKTIGMELISIHTEEENKDLQNFLFENEHEKGYWMAGTKEGDGQYYWATTGTKVLYTHWLKGQPNNARLASNFMEGEHCMQWGMGETNPKPMGWNDLDCTALLPYICQDPYHCIRNIDL